jgi:hypothetical protein
MLTIETRVLGKKSRPMDRWSLPGPPFDLPRDGGEQLTLRVLIERVVRAEVTAFERREQARRFVRVLSESEIAEGAARGKVDPGGRPSSEPVDPEVAVAAALQGFVDGLYLVVLNGAACTDLEAPVYLTNETHLVFLRLTFLAGA